MRYSHYTHLNYFSAGTVFIRQNLTFSDVRFWHIKTVPALKGLRQMLQRHLYFAPFWVRKIKIMMQIYCATDQFVRQISRSPANLLWQRTPVIWLCNVSVTCLDYVPVFLTYQSNSRHIISLWSVNLNLKCQCEQTIWLHNATVTYQSRCIMSMWHIILIYFHLTYQSNYVIWPISIVIYNVPLTCQSYCIISVWPVNRTLRCDVTYQCGCTKALWTINLTVQWHLALSISMYNGIMTYQSDCTMALWPINLTVQWHYDLST